MEKEKSTMGMSSVKLGEPYCQYCGDMIKKPYAQSMIDHECNEEKIILKAKKEEFLDIIKLLDHEIEVRADIRSVLIYTKEIITERHLSPSTEGTSKSCPNCKGTGDANCFNKYSNYKRCSYCKGTGKLS